MKKRKVLLLVATMIAALAIIGCSDNSEKDKQASSDKQPPKIIIQINSSQPSGSIAVNGAYRVKEIVEKELGTDRVEIQVFPDGQLGSDTAIIDGMSLGTHDSLIVGATIPNLDEKFYIYDLPYLFMTREDVEKVTKGEIGKKLNASLAEKGFINIGCWYSGWRHVSNSIRPIVTPDDLKGLKIRIATSKARSLVFEQFGATPVPLSVNEAFSALQQGVVDGQENPAYTMTINSYKDVQKYLSKTYHLVLVYQVVFAKSKWDSYPEDLQKALMKAGQIISDESWKMTDDLEKSVYEELKSSTLQINEIDLEAFKKHSAPLYNDPYFINMIGEELINELLVTLGRK